MYYIQIDGLNGMCLSELMVTEEQLSFIRDAFKNVKMMEEWELKLFQCLVLPEDYGNRIALDFNQLCVWIAYLRKYLREVLYWDGIEDYQQLVVMELESVLEDFC